MGEAPALLFLALVVPAVVPPLEVVEALEEPPGADALSSTVNSIGFAPPTLSTSVAVPLPLSEMVEPLCTVRGQESIPPTFAYVSVTVPVTAPPLPIVTGPMSEAEPGVSVGLVEPSVA